MVECGDCLGFLPEALLCGLACLDLVVKALDGNVSQELVVSSKENCSHAAATYGFQNGVLGCQRFG